MQVEKPTPKAGSLPVRCCSLSIEAHTGMHTRTHTHTRTHAHTHAHAHVHTHTHAHAHAHAHAHTHTHTHTYTRTHAHTYTHTHPLRTDPVHFRLEGTGPSDRAPYPILSTRAVRLLAGRLGRGCRAPGSPPSYLSPGSHIQPSTCRLWLSVDR